MNIEKKTIRSDIPGHHALLHNGYAGSADDQQRRLIVGRDIVLNGDIASCDHLIVEGVVEAQSLTVRRLDIPESGLITGKVEAQDAIIAGRFEGKLTVHGRLTVKAAGRLTGEIEYGALDVEAGGRINARVAAMEAAPAADNVEVLFDTAANDTCAPTAEERPRRRASGR